MMSAHLVVDLAFCVGFALAFNPVCKFVKKFLSERACESEEFVTRSSALSGRLGSMLADVACREGEVNLAVVELLRDAEDRCRAILENGRRDLEALVEEHIDVAAEKLEMRIENFVELLRASAVEAAAGAAHALMKEELEGRRVESGGRVSSSEQDDGVTKKLH